MNLKVTKPLFKCLVALTAGLIFSTVTMASEMDGLPFHCPKEHVYINCGELHSNYDYYGYPKAAYGYGKITIHGPYTEEYLDKCGRGKIIRKWKIKYHYDWYWCTQTIHISDPHGKTFDGYHDVHWPKDFHKKKCDANLHPDHLPYGFNWPEFKHKGCSKLGLRYTDKAHPYSSHQHGNQGYGSGYNYHHPCKVIFRTWELIDWCQYTGHGYGGHYKGRWTYVQKIYIYDDVAPEITFCPEDITADGGDCDGKKVYVKIPKVQAKDDCGEVYYSYTRKHLGHKSSHYGSSYSGGTVKYGGNDASGHYEPGKTLVTFTAFDICGNSTKCDFIVDVVAVDTKPPTVISISSITASLMMTDTNEGMVEIWPEEFNSSSYDNCTDQKDLKFSLEPSVFTCEDFGSNEVKFTVTDKAGNSAYVLVEVIIQANAFPCLGGEVSGTVLSDQGNAVKEVEVTLTGGQMKMTDDSGAFVFDNIPLGEELTISPFKDSDPMEGIDMYDYSLLSLHVEGIRLLKDPRKLIAADIDGNKRIDHDDLFAMERLIFGIDQKMENTSWKFYKRGFIFPDTIDPLLVEIPTAFEVGVYNGEDMSLQFEGIKIGDLGTLEKNSDVLSDVAGENSLLVEDQFLLSGDEIKVPLVLEKDAEANLLSFALDLDPKMAEMVLIDGQSLQNKGILNFIDPTGEGRQVVVSWFSEEGQFFKAGDVVMELTIRAKQQISLSKTLQLKPSVVEAKTEGESGSQKMKLVFSKNLHRDDLVLYQNSPNPFNDYTTIGFYLPEAGEAVLVVRDANGKELLTNRGTYHKGYQEITLNRSNLPVNGLVFYQLESRGVTHTRKMVILN